jgi:hypothetical protein
MRFILLIHLFLLGFGTTSVGQTIAVSGKVRDKDTGRPLVKAIVSIRQIEDKRIVAFTQTSGEGAFEITAAFDPKKCRLEVSSLGYSTQTQAISDKDQPLLIDMERQDFALKEVIVSPQKIIRRSDTLTYLVSAFASAEDRTIGDVLKKLPGVEVLETGEIKYQGQALNKFYIEGSDLLEGRYGLATNNVSHQDVASIEIMENHQPVRALQNVVFSASPAMNIKLKEDAKSRWAGTIRGGGGVPELWEAEAFAMRFKPKSQSLNTYKGNNTGNESPETNAFFPSGDFPPATADPLPVYLQVAPSLASDIGSSRSTFNQTNTLTTHNLAKVGKDLDLLSAFTGSLDRRESEYASQTTYFLGEDRILVEDETENASDFRKIFTGNLRLKANQARHYLNNELNLQYDRADPLLHTLGTFPNTQKAALEHRKLGHRLDLLRRSGDNFFVFRSDNAYASRPQSLQIDPGGQPSTTCEKIRLSSFHSDNSLQYSFPIGNIRVEAPTRFFYQHKAMENAWDEAVNQVEINKWRLSVAPSVQYDAGDALHLSLSGLVFYQALSMDGQVYHFHGFYPRFALHWTASPLLKTGATLSYSTDLPDEQLLYYGQILNNYRNVTAGYRDLSTGETLNLSFHADYKDVLKTLFANLWVSLSKKWQSQIFGQNFEGNHIVNAYYPANYTTERLSVTGLFSKGIAALRGTASVSPMFVHTQSGRMRNGRMIPYSSDACLLKGRIHSTLAEKWRLTYEASYTYSKNRMEDHRAYFSSNRLSESLQTVYSFLSSWQIKYKIDHYCNELSADRYKHFLFSDAAIAYLSGSRWELSCSIKNIFDEKQYSYFIEDDLNTWYRSYTIRPRNLLLSATYRF